MNKSQQDTYLNDYMFLYLYTQIHIKNGVANAILATPLTSSLCISPGLLRDQELLSTHSYDMPPDTHAFTSHCAKIGLKMLLWAEKRSPFLTRVFKQNKTCHCHKSMSNSLGPRKCYLFANYHRYYQIIDSHIPVLLWMTQKNIVF